MDRFVYFFVEEGVVGVGKFAVFPVPDVVVFAEDGTGVDEEAIADGILGDADPLSRDRRGGKGTEQSG